MKGFSYLEPQLQLQNPFIPVLLRSYKLKEWGSSGVHSFNFFNLIFWNGIFNSITPNTMLAPIFMCIDIPQTSLRPNVQLACRLSILEVSFLINTWGSFRLGCCDHRFYPDDSFPFLFNVVCHQSHLTRLELKQALQQSCVRCEYFSL